MINPTALALNLELEGNKVGLPGQEGPFVPEGKIPRSSNIQFQPAQENDQSSRLTEEVNESFEGIEEIKEIEEEVASGKQSSYSYTRQDAQDNVWESPQVVNSKKKRAHLEAFREYYDSNLNEQESNQEIMKQAQSKNLRLSLQKSSALQDSSEGEDQKTENDPAELKSQQQEKIPNEVKKIQVDVSNR